MRAAAPGRPKQGPTLIGVLSFRAAAPGRPKQGPTLVSDRPELVEGSPYPASGVLS